MESFNQTTELESTVAASAQSTALAQDKWWSSLLLQRPHLLARVSAFYRRLVKLARRQQRHVAQKAAVSLTGAAVLLALARSPAAASNITVVNGEVADTQNGKCSLIEAIINANATGTGNQRNDCTKGTPNGPDTINLPTNGQFVLTAVHNTNYDTTGLPLIKSTITINGNGSTIRRDNNAPDFRILTVTPTGILTLNSTSIKNGYFFERYYEEYGGIGGAGILNKGQLTIRNSTIAENVSYGEGGNYYGGGITNDGYLTIESSVIQDNISRGFMPSYGAGGGIYNGPDATLILIDSFVTGNHASGKYAGGGGIRNRGNLSIVDSTIEKNSVWSVYYSGGGGLSNTGNATISGTLIADNNTVAYEYGNYGGGIYNIGVLNIINSTISNNKSTSEDTETYSGGGGLANRSQMIVTNSTITLNRGDGVFTRCGGTTQFNRAITSGNIGYEAHADERDYYCPVETIANNFNAFGVSGNAGVNFALGASDIVPSVGLNSIISPLANNGGATQTHALPVGSPAIDRAPNSQCSSAPVNNVDQRGQPRNQNGSGSSSAIECDIGAFEAAGSTPPPASGFFVSAASAGTVGGGASAVGFDAADILKFTPGSGWAMHFDASDVSVTKNVSAFEILDNGNILLSFAANQSIPGLGTATPWDVVRFVPGSTGNNTAGSFQWYLDGSTVGLTTAGEKIDALGMLADGRLGVSTSGSAAVLRPSGQTLKAQDEDVLGYNLDLQRWGEFFDGTPIPGMKAEDVNALWIDPATGDLYITLATAFNLGGVKGDAKDIVKLTSNGSGGYTPSLYWDGSANGLAADLDGLEIVP